jgi:transcriptional regulator with XRE-family HTH domain
VQLGREIGVSYQAIQEYEKGKHAVDAARLKAIYEPLGTPTGYFFEEGWSRAARRLAHHDSPPRAETATDRGALAGRLPEALADSYRACERQGIMELAGAARWR